MRPLSAQRGEPRRAMASLDRPAIIELLGRLGAESEQTVVQAARELHAKVGESGLTWDDLLRPDPEIGGADAERQDASLASLTRRRTPTSRSKRRARFRPPTRPRLPGSSTVCLRARTSRAPCAGTSPTSNARSPTAASMRRIAAMSALSRSASEPERAARPSGPAAELRRLMLQGNGAKKEYS